MKISTKIQLSEVNNIEFSMHFYRVAELLRHTGHTKGNKVIGSETEFISL